MTEPTAGELYADDAFGALLGARLLDDAPVTVSLDVTDEHCNFRGTAHGAVIYAVADIALSLASNTSGSPSFMIDSHLIATSKALVGDTLTGVAEEMTVGRTLGTYRITVTNQDGRTVALFTGTVIRR